MSAPPVSDPNRDALLKLAIKRGVLGGVTCLLLLVIWIGLFGGIMWLATRSAPGTKPPTPVFVVLMVLHGFAMFFIVLAPMAITDGWWELGKKYPAPPRFAGGTRFRMQSASLGWANYKNILTIRVAPDGLFLALPFPFNFLHRPLLLPWSAVTNPQSRRILWTTLESVDLGQPPEARLSLRNPKILEAARQLQTEAPESPWSSREAFG